MPRMNHSNRSRSVNCGSPRDRLLSPQGGISAAFLAFVLAAQALLPLAAQPAGWSWLNPQPQGNDLNDLHVIDAHTIVAVGEMGSMIKSTDGGANWSVLDSGSIWELNAVWFADAQTGWAASARGLLCTNDGGTTWSQQPGISPNEVLLALFFVNSQTGWAAGGSGKVLKTSDGGISWLPQTTGLAITKTLHEVFFLDATHGWAVGSEGTIIRTTDGGGTWEPAPSGVPGTLHAVHFSDRENGWIVGAASTLLQTSDGGQSWTPRPSSFGIGQNAAAVHWNSAREGWLITTTQIWKTSDGGENWDHQATLGLPEGRSLTTLDFRDPNHLWVAGLAGAVYQSIDGGQTWTHQTPGVRQSWTDAAFVNSQVGWVVGEQGSIHQTSDGGRTWTQQRLSDSFTSGFQSVAFLDDQRGWVVGATGHIYATVDGGMTWDRQTSGSTRTLRSVWFLDAQTGWVVGDSGVILHTGSGGQDWSPQDSGVSDGLRAVQFLDANSGWIVGRSGTVLRTSNGGADWTQVPNAPPGNLEALDFRDAQTGWIVGVGTIYRTTNGGADWTLTVFPLNAFQNLNTVFNAIHFVDADHGWVVGADGTIARTSNGGDDWELVFNPVQNPFVEPTPRLTHHSLTAVQFLDVQTGWAVGAFGTVLRFGPANSVTPPLNAAMAEPGVFRVRWPQDGNIWTLTSADAITAETWNVVTDQPNDDGEQWWTVDLPTDAPGRFFRLGPPGE